MTDGNAVVQAGARGGGGIEATLDAAARLRHDTARLDPGAPVALSYHPLTYAWAPFEAYLRRFGAGPKRALLVGMNPGPWGMGQTGIPFGDIVLVGGWLGLADAPVGRPRAVHPKRPVQGWACTRREASGQRLWGELQSLWKTPERALRDLLVLNHCPLLMFNEAGQNITPDKLRKDDRDEVARVCDAGLVRLARTLAPKILIGVGKYAEQCCARMAESFDADVEVMAIPHPSPASPLANRNGGADWRDSVRATFAEAGLL